MQSDMVEISIPRDLYEKIKNKIVGTSYGSVQDYVINKLESDFPSEPVFTEEEEARIRERLRKLGYIE